MVHPHADMFVAKYPCCHRGNMPCHCWILAYLCRPVMEGDREQQRISNDSNGQSTVAFILVYTQQVLGKSLLDTTPAVSGRPKCPSY